MWLWRIPDERLHFGVEQSFFLSCTTSKDANIEGSHFIIFFISISSLSYACCEDKIAGKLLW